MGDCSKDGSCHCADQLEHIIASAPKCTCSIDGTPYCKVHADPKPKSMSTTGELKIWLPNDVLNTLSLTEQDMWALRASVAEMEKKAVNEPGFANGNGKAAIINLNAKLKVGFEHTDVEMGCKNKSCGCKK